MPALDNEAELAAEDSGDTNEDENERPYYVLEKILARRLDPFDPGNMQSSQMGALWS